MSDFGHKPIKGGGYAPAEEAQISTGPSHRECIHSDSSRRTPEASPRVAWQGSMIILPSFDPSISLFGLYTNPFVDIFHG